MGGLSSPFQLFSTTLWAQECHKLAGETRLAALVCGHYGAKCSRAVLVNPEGRKAWQQLGSPASFHCCR